MRPDLVSALLIAVSGGVGVKLIDLLWSAWRRMRAEAHDRETAVQRAERERDRWELVARRTRVIAVDLGAPLEGLPLGPGEDGEDET